MGRFGTPSLITRNTNDVQQVQMLIAIGLTLMVMAPMLMIGGIIMALRQDVPLSAALVVILPIMGVFIFVVLRRAIPLFRTIQARIDKINQILRESSGRHPGHQGVRPDRLRGEAVRRGEPATHRHDGQRLPALRPRVSDPLPDHEPLDRGHHVVRRAAGGQRRHADRESLRLHRLRHADPVRRPHVHHARLDDPPRRRLRRPHTGSAGCRPGHP